MVGEVARNKALAIALGKVSVVDTNGKAVDLTGFVVEDEADAEAEVVAEAEEIADEARRRGEAGQEGTGAQARRQEGRHGCRRRQEARAKKAPAKKADAE
jgi:trigger factor